MIKTLQLACDKQSKGILFGPQDVKGSAIALINRGLIASHVVKRRGKNIATWYVTQQAMNMLAEAGVRAVC